MKEINDILWADSDLHEIRITYDMASLCIWNDCLQQLLRIDCVHFAGMTSLCIWDDTILSSLEVCVVQDIDNDFLRTLYRAYAKDYDYGGRMLAEGLKELRVKLVNGTVFSMYALEIALVSL